MKIISASRRTDIPAFYGEWLMNRIREGFAGHVNPFSGKKYLVSLKKNDVAAIALWSKNFTPFINNAVLLKDEGCTLFFNYTITGLPAIFEPNCPAEDEAVDSMQQLSSIFSPLHINWRYDPVLVTDITDTQYHVDKFARLCSALSGYVKRCYLSFPTMYGKVEKNFRNFTGETAISFQSLSIHERIEFAEKLSAIAQNHGIEIYSCCGDYLSGNRIKKGHCIDGGVISTISGLDLSGLKPRPTRKECGCTESTDIGIYNACPHGCVYCYANINHENAFVFHKKYMQDEGYSTSAFLGMTKEVSDAWVKQVIEDRSGDKYTLQPELF